MPFFARLPESRTSKAVFLYQNILIPVLIRLSGLLRIKMALSESMPGPAMARRGRPESFATVP
jgi:hypothetical protein